MRTKKSINKDVKITDNKCYYLNDRYYTFESHFAGKFKLYDRKGDIVKYEFYAESKKEFVNRVYDFYRDKHDYVCGEVRAAIDNGITANDGYTYLRDIANACNLNYEQKEDVKDKINELSVTLANKLFSGAERHAHLDRVSANFTDYLFDNYLL